MLVLLALITLIAKTWVEWKTRQQAIAGGEVVISEEL
jgi:ABC-type sulfate transport system permease subunit